MPAHRKIEPDQHYGRLRTVRRDAKRNAWLCVCGCGAEVFRSTKSLLGQPNPSCRACGSRAAAHAGAVNGGFECTEVVGRDGNRNALWLWRCSCGRGEEITTYHNMMKRVFPVCQFCVNDRRLAGM